MTAWPRARPCVPQLLLCVNEVLLKLSLRFLLVRRARATIWPSRLMRSFARSRRAHSLVSGNITKTFRKQPMTKSAICSHGPRPANRKGRESIKIRPIRGGEELPQRLVRIDDTIPALIRQAHQTHRPAHMNKTDFDHRRRYRCVRRLAKISNPAARGRDRRLARVHRVGAIDWR